MSDFIERLRDEHAGVRDRRIKLLGFLGKGQPANISNEHWSLLHIQNAAMTAYEYVLERRLNLLAGTE